MRAYLRDRGADLGAPDMAALAARTNYGRETYAYRDEVHLPGIEAFRDDAGLAEAARHLEDKDLAETTQRTLAEVRQHAYAMSEGR